MPTGRRPDFPPGTRTAREDLSRFQRAHHQHGPAAPRHPRRVARHPQAGRRKSSGHRMRDRLPPSRGGEDCRAPYLHHVQSLRGSHGLRGRGLERPGLLRSGRKAAQRGSSAPRPIHSRDPHRTESPGQPHALAGHARARYRRHHAAVLHLPRPGRDSQDFREVLRRPPDHARLPHRRMFVRNL